MSVNLGTWHTYKHANALLWKALAFDFWIPLHLDLFPNQSVFKNRNLFKHVWWFNLLRLSYPDWKKPLRKLIGATDDDNVLKNHLLNLRDFMEFFIPAVSVSAKK